MIANLSVMWLWKQDSSMNGRGMKDIEDKVIAANIQNDYDEIKDLKSKLKKIGKEINKLDCTFKPECDSKSPWCKSCLLKSRYKEIMKNG